jgi:outer membrane protein TolC
MIRFHSYHLLVIASVFGLSTSPEFGGETRHLTLTDAVHLALKQNRALKIARLKVVESEQKKAGERSAYFPSITNQSNVLHITELQGVGIPAGAFGAVGGTFVPTHALALPQGKNTFVSSGTTITQPLTQLIRIHDANRIAEAGVAVSRDDLKKAEIQVALQVHRLYYEMLITRLQKRAAEQQTRYAGEHLRESEDDVRNGNALRVAAIESRAGVLEGQQSVLTADLQLSDLNSELNDLLGLPLDTQLELEPTVPATFEEQPREEYLRTAWTGNPEILAAEQVVQKARAAVGVAKSAYIPDITAYARHSYQDGVPFLVHNFGTFGVNLSWEVFDFGKRRAAVREHEAQLAQAEENLQRLKDEVGVAVERSYNKVERTRSMVQVATEVVKLRHEGERLSENQYTQGAILVSEKRHATAASYTAEADYLRAHLGYLLAWAELEETVGRTPGL